MPNETVGLGLKQLIQEEKNPSGYVVLYATFGVVKGRLLSSTIAGSAENGDGDESAGTLIEIGDATVEHYSSHLPTASFGRLFIRGGDVQGFALLSSQSQG